MSNSERLCLTWGNYETSMMATLKNLLTSENDDKDVTLVSDDGKQFRSHKFILKSTSVFFQKLFSSFPPQNQHPNPIVYLTNIKSNELESLLKFMYLGTVNLGQDELKSFLFAAEKLNIQGLEELFPSKQPRPSTAQSLEELFPSSSKTPASSSAAQSSDKDDISRETPSPESTQYDYQHPQVSPPKNIESTTTTTTKTNVSDKSHSSFDPIELMQHQSKDLYDPVQELLDGLMIKQEPNTLLETFTIPKATDELTLYAAPVAPEVSLSEGNSIDSMSLQFLDWNRGVGNECVVSSADTQVSSTETRMYSCHQCDYKSTKLFNVKKHTASIHDGIRYPCKFCDYRATESGHLKKHMKTRHGHSETVLSLK